MELLHREKQPCPAQQAKIKSRDEKVTHHSAQDRSVVIVCELETTSKMLSARQLETTGEAMGQRRIPSVFLLLLFLSFFFCRDGGNLSHEGWWSGCIIHPVDPLTFQLANKACSLSENDGCSLM